MHTKTIKGILKVFINSSFQLTILVIIKKKKLLGEHLKFNDQN